MNEPAAEKTDSPRRTGVRALEILTIAVKQVQELVGVYPVERVVDLGTPGKEFLPAIARLTGLPVVGSALPEIGADDDPALRHIAYVQATPPEMVRRFRSPGTLFTAISTFGLMSPSEVQMIFDGIGSAVTFAARGVLAGESREREGGGGWDHNYVDLLKGWELLELQAQPRPKLPGVETIVGTAWRR